MVYETHRILQKRNMRQGIFEYKCGLQTIIENKPFVPIVYKLEQFIADFKILVKLLEIRDLAYKVADKIFFKIKFFRQLEKIVFINPLPYLMFEDGPELALKDVEDLAILYFK